MVWGLSHHLRGGAHGWVVRSSGSTEPITVCIGVSLIPCPHWYLNQCKGPFWAFMPLLKFWILLLICEQCSFTLKYETGIVFNFQMNCRNCSVLVCPVSFQYYSEISYVYLINVPLKHNCLFLFLFVIFQARMVLPLHMILPDPLSMRTESTGVGIVQAWMVSPATRRRI